MVFADYDVYWLHVSTVCGLPFEIIKHATEIKNRLSSNKKHKNSK